MCAIFMIYLSKGGLVQSCWTGKIIDTHCVDRPVLVSFHQQLYDPQWELKLEINIDRSLSKLYMLSLSLSLFAQVDQSSWSTSVQNPEMRTSEFIGYEILARTIGSRRARTRWFELRLVWCRRWRGRRRWIDGNLVIHGASSFVSLCDRNDIYIYRT